MATAATYRKPPLLDLSFLTAEERAKVETVVRADQNMLVQDRVRVGTLRQELEKERYFQKLLLGKAQCTCCEQKLGRLFNSGTPCPSCLYQVCNDCRVLSHKPPPLFLCPVCAKKRLLDIQAAEYISLPTADFSPSPLFGSQLVFMSLEASRTGESSLVNPYDGKARKRLNSSLSRAKSTESNPRSGTNDSSIVVRYAEGVSNGRSPSVTSGRSDSGSEGRRERPSSLPARRVSPSEYSSSDEEEDKNVLGVPGLTKLKHSESISSIGSLTSMYSAMGGKGDYAISGEIRFGVWFSRDGLLKVHVDQARNLAAARKEGYSYPYVKVYLLPDRSKRTKRKTGFVRRTVCPKYDETFKYKLSESELSSRTVWLSVWDWDRFGRNQFLGEVRLPLQSLDLTDTTDHWHTLLDQDESSQLEMEGQYRGRLFLGLMFQLSEEPCLPLGKNRKPRRKGVLHVAIKKAEDLPKMDADGHTNAVVKCYLLPSRTTSNKRKTQVLMNTTAPVWNEEFLYKSSEKDLQTQRALEVTIWDFDKRGSNDLIGGLHIGPGRLGSASQGPDWMDSFGEEVSHWEMVLARPGEWVEQWHTLRPRMDRALGSLPQKPATPYIRELSPVPERLSPPAEEVEHEGEGVVGPVSSKVRASSVSLGGTTEGAISASPRSQTLPSPEPNGKKPSPLVQSRKKRDDVTSDPGVLPSVESHSQSPIPQLLVTLEPGEVGGLAPPAGIPHSTSSGSISSTAALSEGEVGRGNYEISGDVQLGFLYRSEKLSIHVSRARELAAADSNGVSDPYVKTYLLPDHSKSSKRKTAVQKKTLNPVFDETLEYKLSESELSSRTVWLSVWDWDRFGRNQFLGEIRLPLQSLDLRSDTELWYPLVDKDQPYYSLNPSSSQLQLALKFLPRETVGGVTQCAVSVEIKRARNLFPSDSEETGVQRRSYVTCTLLPDTAQMKKTVSEVSSDPTFRESFTFDGVTVEEIAKERVLEVAVWDCNRDSFIGGLRFGPSADGSSQNREWMDSIGDEVFHWEMVLARPGEWVERWHTLRKNMSPMTTTQLVPTATRDHTPSNDASLDNEFRKVVTKTPKSVSSSDRAVTRKDEFHKTAAAESSRADNRTKTDPPKQDKERPTTAKANQLTKTAANDAKRGPTTLGEEFRKINLTSNGASSLPRSIPPEEIARSSERPRSMSPEITLPAGPLKRAGLLGVKHGGSHSSFGSQLSIYSSAGAGRGDYEISGEILLGISYGRDRMLSIHVSRARELAAADSNGVSDPYVKTYLLPDHSKSSKRKTAVQKKTLNPVFDQTLKYIVAPAELNSRTVWLSVWDWDRFGRNQFLGEIRLPLASLDLNDTSECWYTLQDKDDDPAAADYYRGQLHLALRYSPIGTKKGKTRGSLDVIIKQGRDFPSMGGNSKPDPVVKCYLLPDRSSSGKRKVGVIKNRSDPVWEEMVTYEKVVLEDMVRERVLEVTVWDWDKKGNSFIGGLRIGPSADGSSRNRQWTDSIGDEVSHWEMVLAQPGEWVEQWHTLRTTMDPRNIAIQ